MNILALAPHTDDIEFGCGGTIHRLAQEGHTVLYIAFSDCKESVPAGFPEDVLRKELRNAITHLGIEQENCRILDYKVRMFNFSRQSILEDLVKIQRAFKPEMVFTPCRGDVHQDHNTITVEAMRAFKRTTIYGYELPWNLLELPSTCLFRLEKENVEAKIRAIEEYKTQLGRGYSNPDYIRALALTRGTRINVPYAEAFEVIRLIQ